MRAAYVVFCLVAVTLFSMSSASALEIRVAPQTLVLSSGGGQFTVHTDVPFLEADGADLTVNGEFVAVRTFADDRGNLVAQCAKEVVKDAIGDFDGKTTTATVTLTVNGVSASEDIAVKK